MCPVFIGLEELQTREYDNQVGNARNFVRHGN